VQFAFYALFWTQAWFSDLKRKDAEVKQVAKAAEKELLEEMVTRGRGCINKKQAKEVMKMLKEEEKAEKLAAPLPTPPLAAPPAG
jgi:hypothetical protein